MAVREALLALLTAGPAYGFQLHSELAGRTGHRRTVNPGQTYATLDRLRKQALIESAGNTTDGLPLYRLTATGRITAENWLTGGSVGDWNDTIERVLIALSLAHDSADEIIAHELDIWSALLFENESRQPDNPPLNQLAVAASTAQASALLGWLETVAAAIAANPTRYRLHRDPERPRRGRRPAA